MRGGLPRWGILAAAAAATIGAGLASASPQAPALRSGGIFRVGSPGGSVAIDPQVAYTSTAWWLEDATAARLYRQRGKRLVPEVASRFVVSRDGRTYTFWLRRGFRFSDGTAVTAKSFRYAFERIHNPSLQSPALSFVQDVRSVTANGRRLVVRLGAPAPDLLSRLALPFFQATSAKLPAAREVTAGYPSAGPYYFSSHDANRLTSLRRNPYWKRGGRHLAGVDVTWNEDEQAAFQHVLANDLDLGPIPAAEVAGLAQRFGVNRTRFWVEPSSCLALAMFNNSRGVFAGNPSLRKAVNWALDRRALAEQAGLLNATPWTHILSPSMPGSITAKRSQPYGIRPNIAKARKLARGHLRSGRIVIVYRAAPSRVPQVQLMVDALVRLGFDRDKIVLRGFPGGDIYDFIATNGDWDFSAGTGWCADVPDPGFGLFGVRSAKFERRLAAAERLKGNARARAFGKLDLQIMRELAPVAPLWVYNSRFLFSNRVDPRSLVYEPVLQSFSIRALALK